MNNGGCIYKIENSQTGKMYIGATKRFDARMKQHLNMLNGNKHFSKDFQSEWNEYGQHSFLFTVIEESDEENLFPLEEKYIIANKGKTYNGVNPTGGARPNTKKRADDGRKNNRNLSGKGGRKGYVLSLSKNNEVLLWPVGRKREVDTLKGFAEFLGYDVRIERAK